MDNTYSEIWTNIQTLFILEYTAGDISFSHLRECSDILSINNFNTTYHYGIEVFLMVLNNNLLEPSVFLSQQHAHFIAIVVIWYICI